MRIAFLNPWLGEAAENQAFSSLSVAAEREGHDLVLCRNSSEVETCKPDFVLVSASTQAKLNDFPHYGVVHEPRDRFLTSRVYFNNLVSYDGYLTISDNLERFIRDAGFGVGFPRPVGYYYNTPQRQDGIKTDLHSLIDQHKLKITYVGTNWEHEKRRPNFFLKLSQSKGIEICGPAHSWDHIDKQSYGGLLPFDGVSVQRKYAANGIGLCMLSDLHLRDDVISNRVFEITSVGAVAFCCDTPWIRKYFGDSVYYFQQDLPDRSLKLQILGLRDLVYDEPDKAIEKAERARRIFETKFSAEIMISHAVDYHARISSERKAYLQAAEGYSPLISVIVRCGSKPIDYVRRALQSISNQTYGRFEVILVRHLGLDLSPLFDSQSANVLSLKQVDCFGGDRSASLWAGLAAVTGEYFAVLDDDDWWFSNHFERLFHPLPKARQYRFFAYSGSVVVHKSAQAIDGGGQDVRALGSFGITSRENWLAIGSGFASNCFVASADLLHADLLRNPEMETAEDSYLILSLFAQVEPRFSYAATCVVDRSLADKPSWEGSTRRYEDELSLILRLFRGLREEPVQRDSWKQLEEHWAKRGSSAFKPSEPEVILGLWDEAAKGFDESRSYLKGESKFVDPVSGTAIVQPPVQPWAYGAVLSLNLPRRESTEYMCVVELTVRRGTVGVGLLNASEEDYLLRSAVLSHDGIQRVFIPISDFSRIGRLVLQNWDAEQESEAELAGIRILAEPDP